MNKPKLSLKRQAKKDVEFIVAYIATDNPDIAKRFFTAFKSMLPLLIDMSEIGRECDFKNEFLFKIRMIHIVKFPRYFIFYRKTGSKIEVLRVLHGARDLPIILEL